MMNSYEQEMEDRANGAIDFTDFEEPCANCGQPYGDHELREGCRGLGTYCPEHNGCRCCVFALPEADEGL